MRYFNNPECPHCGYTFEDYDEYYYAEIEFIDDNTKLLECPNCGEQFRVDTEEIEREML